MTLARSENPRLTAFSLGISIALTRLSGRASAGDTNPPIGCPGSFPDGGTTSDLAPPSERRRSYHRNMPVRSRQTGKPPIDRPTPIRKLSLAGPDEAGLFSFAARNSGGRRTALPRFRVTPPVTLPGTISSTAAQLKHVSRAVCQEKLSNRAHRRVLSNSLWPLRSAPALLPPALNRERYSTSHPCMVCELVCRIRHLRTLAS